jgi:hypothetical protein
MAAYAMPSVSGKKTSEFYYDVPQTACGQHNLFALHNFSKCQRDFVDRLYNFSGCAVKQSVS